MMTGKSLRMRRGARALVVLGLVAVAATPVVADDWAQWRGPGRLAVWQEDGIVESFPEGGLTVTWRTPLRSGFAGPAVAGGRVFVLDWMEDPQSRTLDGTERLVALDEETGEVLWTHEWTTTYRMLMASYAVGPRATPTVDGDRVYAVGATGRLFCFDVASGDVLWSKDYIADYDTSVPTWGIASAPLVDGDKLIAVVGGEPDALVVAFDKRTGEEIWRAVEVVGERWATGSRSSTRRAARGNSSSGMQPRWCPSTRRRARSTGRRSGRSEPACRWRPRCAAATTCSSRSSTTGR